VRKASEREAETLYFSLREKAIKAGEVFAEAKSLQISNH
jgi:hypothetical protein